MHVLDSSLLNSTKTLVKGRKKTKKQAKVNPSGKRSKTETGKAKIHKYTKIRQGQNQ